MQDQEIIKSILALYHVAGQGNYETDYDNLKKGFYALAAECQISVAKTKRIWGIVSDIYNREHNGNLLDEPLRCLQDDLTSYFSM